MDLVFDKQLKLLLERNRMSASRLAELTGISVQTIHNWLSGQSPRKIEQLKVVADYFGCSLEYLLFQSKTNPNESFESFRDEINAGVYEVILRPIRKKSE